MKEMNSLIINHSDVNEGGASFAGFNIYKGLAEYSHYDSFMLCARKQSSEVNISEIPNKGKHNSLETIFGKVKRRIFNRVYGGEYWSLQGENIFDHPFYKQAQVVNVHNLHGENYFSYTALSKIIKEKPLVLTMQDMWYFTGHCAYSYECRGYETGCRTCPHLDYFPALKYDKAGFHFKNKMEIYRSQNIYFISCSRWFAELANRVLLANGIEKEVLHINNPIETASLYKEAYSVKEATKQYLGIPLHKKIICFGAAQVYEPRKGLAKFLERVDKEFVDKQDLYLLLIGNETGFEPVEIPSFLPYSSVGNLTDAAQRNRIYNIADLFIFPSLADDLPNMILETLCSELPVVCFDVGGNKEVVHSGTSGYLAVNGDYDDFFKGIQQLLTLPDELREEIGRNARKIVMGSFSMEACASAYEKIFDRAFAAFKA